MCCWMLRTNRRLCCQHQYNMACSTRSELMSKLVKAVDDSTRWVPCDSEEYRQIISWVTELRALLEHHQAVCQDCFRGSTSLRSAHAGNDFKPYRGTSMDRRKFIKSAAGTVAAVRTHHQDPACRCRYSACRYTSIEPATTFVTAIAAANTDIRQQ